MKLVAKEYRECVDGFFCEKRKKKIIIRKYNFFPLAKGAEKKKKKKSYTERKEMLKLASRAESDKF